MASVNIKAGELLNTFVYVLANGKNVKGEQKPFNNDCIVEIIDDGIKIGAIEDSQALRTDISITIQKSDILETGEIPVELDKAIERLKRFDAKDVINFSFSEQNNLITFKRDKPKLVSTVKTIDSENVKSTSETGNPFEFDEKGNFWFGKKSGVKLNTYISIDADDFKEIIKDGEQIKHRSFPFSITKDNFEVTVSDDDSGELFSRNLSVKKIINPNEEIKTVFSHGFGNVFANLEGEIEIWVGNGLPAIIRKKKDNTNLTYTLASLELENEEEEKPENKKEAEINKKLEKDIKGGKKTEKKTEKKIKKEEETDPEEDEEEVTEDEEESDETEDEEESDETEDEEETEDESEESDENNSDDAEEEEVKIDPNTKKISVKKNKK
jgi:hypothetical protein